MSTSRTLINSSIRRSEELSNVNHYNWAKHNFEVWFGERRASHVVAPPVPDDDGKPVVPNLARRYETLKTSGRGQGTGPSKSWLGPQIYPANQIVAEPPPI